MADLERAQEAIASAEALLITAGAGMGVDSGLPDFRGTEGFWNAYPPYRALGLSFIEMANPEHFRHDPELGWGFYGHRRNLYAATTPHAGFQTLLDFGKRLPGGVFVFTSNVNGHFQQSGFDNDCVHECHGSIRHSQCTAACGQPIWAAEDDPRVRIDEETMRAVAPHPTCPGCGALARPAILMFGDWQWDSSRSDAQAKHYQIWLNSLQQPARKLVILEFGAGTGVPTVRMQSEQITRSIEGAQLIRVNPREPDGPPGTISLPMGALEAINAVLCNRN